MKTCFVTFFRLKKGSVMSAGWALGNVCNSEEQAKKSIEYEKRADIERFGGELFEYKYEEKAVL